MPSALLGNLDSHLQLPTPPSTPPPLNPAPTFSFTHARSHEGYHFYHCRDPNLSNSAIWFLNHKLDWEESLYSLLPLAPTHPYYTQYFKVVCQPSSPTFHHKTATYYIPMKFLSGFQLLFAFIWAHTGPSIPYHPPNHQPALYRQTDIPDIAYFRWQQRTAIFCLLYTLDVLELEHHLCSDETTEGECQLLSVFFPFPYMLCRASSPSLPLSVWGWH